MKSIRRKPGDWVCLAPNSGFVGESNRLKAEILPEENPEPHWCGDEKCCEWATLWTEADPITGERFPLYHVGECEMSDEPQKEKS